MKNVIAKLARHWALAVSSVVAVVALGVALFFATRPPLVAVAVASRREVVQTLVASGRVLPAARVELAALTLGRVVTVGAEQGAHVESGTVLVELDGAEAEADLARVEAVALQARAHHAEIQGPSAATAAETLRRAELDLGQASGDLARLERLASSGGVAEQELAHARSLVAQRESARQSALIGLTATRGVQGREAAADVARAEADVSAAHARVDDHRVTAPAAGSIIARSVDVGDVVQPGQQLIVLAVDGAARVRIDPDESSLALLAIGQSALVSPEAFPDHRFPARVSFIASAVDPARGTIEVWLDVPDAPTELLSDMTVSVDVEVARRPNALVLPAQAIHGIGTPAPFVLVVEGDVATSRLVRLGAIGEDDIEIVEGLEGGERAILSELASITAGAHVRVP